MLTTMKRILTLALTLLCALALLPSCQKAPELTITSPASIDLSADGSSGSITFTANRAWRVSSSDSWVTLSPSSGEPSETPVTVSVRCSANTTYEDRTATVTITMEELSQKVTVRQPANKGIVLPTQSYDLQSSAKTIEVTVQANVDYTVETSVNWIKQTGTKGLTSKTLTFSIEENKTYDAREGKITIKPTQAGVAEQVISVKQAQKDALIVEKTSYDMPFGGGEIEIKVEANVAFDVTPNVEWLHHVSTKALSTSTVLIKVDENATYSAREGKIEIAQQNGTLKHTITVKQAGRIAVTSVELDQTSLTLKPEETVTLVATVKPDNATDKTVTWTSSDTSIATVDETGKVTAIKDGSATITAAAGEKKAECKVEVSSIIVFKDARFKAYLLKDFDTNGDGEISQVEADEVGIIKCENNGITSMEDIIHFHNVKILSLNCLDLSTLDVSSCSRLQKLECISDKLTSLNISGCNKLEYLDCENNKLTKLDIGNLSQLKFLNCRSNQLPVLDISNNTKLEELNCSVNPITSLDFSACASLRTLNCASNLLSTLDLGGLVSLEELDCGSNQIEFLDVSLCASLRELYCRGNKYTSLDFSNNTTLQKIACSGQQLKNVIVDGCSSLKNFECSSSQITTLDVKNCPSLQMLLCSFNPLTSLDLSGCASLQYLSCSVCQLTSLRVDGCTSLQEMHCVSNSLSGLDVLSCQSLRILECSDNPFTTLSVKDLSSLEYIYCQVDQLVDLDVRGCSSLLTLNCSGNKLTSLEVSDCTQLDQLTCSSNQLSSINVNSCAKLTSLSCGSNQLSSLDVKNNTLLQSLSCDGNNLESLDLSGLVSLVSLNCGSNKLQTLDISNNLKLDRLDCRFNPSLKELWLKTGQTLYTLYYDRNITEIKYKD